MDGWISHAYIYTESPNSWSFRLYIASMKFMTTDYSIHQNVAALPSVPRSLYDLLNQHYMEYAGQRYATQTTLVANVWGFDMQVHPESQSHGGEWKIIFLGNLRGRYSGAMLVFGESMGSREESGSYRFVVSTVSSKRHGPYYGGPKSQVQTVICFAFSFKMGCVSQEIWIWTFICHDRCSLLVVVLSLLTSHTTWWVGMIGLYWVLDTCTDRDFSFLFWKHRYSWLLHQTKEWVESRKVT